MSKALLNSMVWRRALKKFDPASTNVVNINPILEAAQLAPSSLGLTPYHIQVVSNKDLKEKLLPVSMNQQQVLLCSHLLVFVAHSNGPKAVERFIKSHDTENKDRAFAEFLRSTFSSMDDKSFLSFSTAQAYISLGFGLTAAADLKIGSCPMGGFLPDGVKQVLELNEDEVPVAYMAVGNIPEDYASAAPYPKWRMPLTEFVKFR